MLGVGVIGLGVGEKHAQAFASHPGCRVVRLCDMDQERLDACSRVHPQARLSTDAADVLDDPDVGIVSVASHDDNHFGQIMTALANGKHVFAEKPLCLRPEELRAIRAALAANPGLRLSSNLNLRTCPRFQWLKRAVDGNDLGRLFHMEADYLWGRVAKLTHGWRPDMDYYSIVLGAAVHMIDLALWLTGKRPVAVQGMGNRIATQGSRMRFDDFATLHLQFQDGLIVKVSANGGCVHRHFHRVVAFGTEKTFVHEETGARLHASRDPGQRPESVAEEYPGAARKAELAHSFADAILNPSSRPLVDEEDIFATMSVCFAAEQAIRSGRSVVVDYL